MRASLPQAKALRGATTASRGADVVRGHARAGARARLAHWTYWPRLGPRRRDTLRVGVWPNHVTGSENPYQTIVYAGAPVQVVPFWHLRDALRLQRLGQIDLLHIHFDEGYAYQATPDTDAEAAQAHIAMLRAFRARGGRYVWTLHNTNPAVYAERPGFALMRRHMAETSDLIVVHTPAAAAYLRAGFAVDPARIVLIEHPSFLGWIGALPAATPPPARRRFLQFGDIKAYKGVNRALAGFAELSCPERAEYIIAGKPDAGVTLDLARFPDDGVLRTSLERVPEADVPGLFAGADFTLLAYDRLLTSGVALMSVSYGVPVIAPAFGEMAGSLPTELGPLLYDPDAPDGLRRALEYACTMPADAHLALQHACRAFAERIAPEVQACKLMAALGTAGLLPGDPMIAGGAP